MPEQADIVRFVEAKSWYMIDWIKLDSNPKYSSKISAGFSVFEYEEKKTTTTDANKWYMFVWKFVQLPS